MGQEVPHLPAGADIDAVVDTIAVTGCVVLDDVVDAPTLDRIVDELTPYRSDTPFGVDDFTGHATRRTGALIARSPTFRSLAVHPTVIGTLDRVIGHSTSYQLHLTQVIDIGPGETAQVVHRDQWAFDFFPFPAGYEVECHTMWALTDFTEANGATRVIPGSHRWEDRLRPEPEQTVPAEMTRGSVLLYLGSLYHGGGTNRTEEVRSGINVGYTLGWLRQEENQYLACPAEVARCLPHDLLRLMGYSRAAYALGYVGDTLDPLDVLLGRTGRTGFVADGEPPVPTG
jgi:ectoine hydroxylase-related dioxygenase (phytanoyl-CoA dioxygenase family)